jgi:hypothetical protein
MLLNTVFLQGIYAAKEEQLILPIDIKNIDIVDVDGNSTQVNFNFNAENGEIEVIISPNASQKDVIRITETKVSKIKVIVDKHYSDLEKDPLRVQIAALAALGILKSSGLSQSSYGKFSPENIVTRSEFALALDKTLQLIGKGYPGLGEKKVTFSDVKETDGIIESLKNLNANGNFTKFVFSKGKFEPDRPITKEEVAIWISNEVPTTNKKASFKDEEKIKQKEEVNRVVQSGILTIDATGNFDPERKITKREMASLLYKLITSKMKVRLIYFKDTEKHWANKFILQMAYLEIINGFPDGTFGPNKTITRAEFAALLERILKQEDHETPNQIKQMTFNDVKEDKWYYSSVAWLVHNGNISVANYEKGMFNPEQPITREEIASWIENELQMKDLDPLPFEDKDQIKFKNAVLKVFKDGLMVGNNNLFRPKESATRAEAATILWRFLQFKGSDKR